MNNDANNHMIEEIYKLYPILEVMDKQNDNLIKNNIIFKDLEAGELLMSYGSSCVGFLFVISGMIKIKKLNEEGNETYLYDIVKGELCHEAISCHMNNASLIITGVAMQKSQIAILPFEIAQNYILTSSEFLEYCYKDLYNKFAKITSFKEASIHEDIETRIVKWLLAKDSKYVYITHLELAFELGTAREVVSRKLKVLEKKGYIGVQRGKINIYDNLKLYIQGGK